MGPLLGILLWVFFSAVIIRLAVFFRGSPVLQLRIPDEKLWLEFWIEKKNRTAIQDLLSEVESRKVIIQRKLDGTFREMIPKHIYFSIRSFVVSLFLFSIPALVTETPSWLALCLLAVLWQLYKLLRYSMLNRLLRKAIRAITREDVALAIRSLETLAQESSLDFDSQELLFYSYIKAEQFEKSPPRFFPR